MTGAPAKGGPALVGYDGSPRATGAVEIGARGRSAYREILLGSVAMTVLHHADRPVLVVPSGRFPA